MNTSKIRRLQRVSGVLSIVIVLLIALSGCDSNGNNNDGDNNNNNGFKTEFRVKYEVTGSCDFIAAVGYTLSGGGTGGDSITIPWSFEFDMSAPERFTAVALSASCSSQTGNPNTITGKLIVDGVERDSQTATGTATISVSVAAILN